MDNEPIISTTSFLRYLYEFLYGWLISALSRADTFLMENEILNELQKTGKGAARKKPRYKKRNALMGFRLEGKLQMPHPRFDSEQVRYEHRFAPFQNLLTPPPVVYSEFRDMTSFERFQQQSLDSVYLYIAGCKHFHQARQLLESIQTDPEIVNLLTICKTNFIVLKLLAGGHKKESLKPPEFDFSKSKYFSIIKLN
nr:unnamed protein product [Callosobruchus analis]